MCVLIFSTLFVRNISHSKKKWARYDTNVYWSSCKVPFIFVRFSRNWNFLDIFSKNYQISLTPIQWESSCSIRADRRTNMTKLIATFRNFANAPKNEEISKI